MTKQNNHSKGEKVQDKIPSLHLSKINWQSLFAECSREHTKLIKWLFDNHKDVLREYERYTKSKLRVEFV